MTVAPVAHAQAVPLSELVDGLALRTGAWVVVERFGTVVTHGAGRTPCPPAVTAALLGKRSAPLREAVRWVRGTGALRGSLDDAPVVALELGDGTTAWFVDGAPEEGTDAVLRTALADTGPVIDPVVQELLHPRGPSRQGRAPAALLAVLHSTQPLPLLARSALAGVGGTDARVHTETDVVVVAQEAAAAVLQALVIGPLERLRAHDARSGGSLVETLTAWCAAGCDINTAARRLHVHTNTLRYRLRRAAEISGLDLDRPRHVLALQLLLAV